MPHIREGEKLDETKYIMCLIYVLNIYTAPTAPRGLSLSTVRYFPNLIIATWTPPNTTNGIITAYSVYCNTSVNGLIIGAKTNATTLVVTINTGSDMFTQCSCYVTANTSIGEGTPSQMISIESREPHRICYSCRSIFPHCHSIEMHTIQSLCNIIEELSFVRISL